MHAIGLFGDLIASDNAILETALIAGCFGCADLFF